MSPIGMIRQALLLCLSSILLIACGGGDGSSTGPTDTPPPTVLAQTPSTRLLGDFDVITLTFSESMDTGSYSLGGNLAAESNGGVWSQTNVINDTLTIAPQPNWPANTNRTLIINVNDLAGNALPTLTLTHDVYRGVAYYVNEHMPNDLLDGMTPTRAKRTIMSAVDAATAPATVFVQSGLYRVAVGGPERVVLKEGVSLYGGYNADFTERVPGDSIIWDYSSFTTTQSNPNFAVLGNAGITSATLLDGFTLQGTNDDSSYTAGLRLRDGAAPTVQNNRIGGGGGGGSSAASYGVYIQHGETSVIQNNTIDGGTGRSSTAIIHQGSPLSSLVLQHNSINGGAVDNSVGIELLGGSTVVRHNTIFGGSALNDTNGIRVSSGVHSIENNLIHAGRGATSTGISNTQANISARNNTVHGGNGNTRAVALKFSYSNIIGSGFEIQNNIIMTQHPDGICIHSTWAWPPAHNVFHCSGALYQNNTTTYLGLNNAGNLTTNADGTGAEFSPAGSNNLAIDPLLADIDGPDNNIHTMADNDWRLSAATPASVIAGGLNGIDEGWSFTTDKDGVTRPASGTPWSIGAYEPTP